jgi:prepilin-type N-terminal cleavage/methylation domain-containing protein
MQRRRHAFTLIELLTVIAIIAILTAISFPVFSRTKDSAYRSSDISAMNSLRTALQLYRADQGGYPPALLGFVNRYASGPNQGQVIPADQASGFLYPKRVQSITTFQPSYNRVEKTVVTGAVWPCRDPRPVGTAPLFDLNGDGQIDGDDDPAQARQRFGSGVAVGKDRGAPGTGNNAEEFYRISGYDVAEVREANCATGELTGRRVVELRYSLFWTDWGLADGNGQDDPRQLGYADPPDSTPITWNSFFRDYGGDVVNRGRRDIILFLGGAARTIDSRAVNERSWRIMP